MLKHCIRGRTMTLDEAIDRLKEARAGHIEFLSVETLNMAIKALEQNKRAEEWYKLFVEKLDQETKWIPVSKRLPTKEEYIANNGLFIVSDGNRTYAKYFDIYDSMKYFGEPTMSGLRVDRCVAAWQPLPEPYAPQAESEDR